MAGIFDALPLLEGWRWVYEVRKPIPPQTIPPGGKHAFLEKREWRCWVIGGAFHTDNPDLIFHVDFDHQRIRFTPRELHEAGIAQPHNLGFWISRHDLTVTPPFIFIMFSPMYPLPVWEIGRVFFMNPLLRPDGTPNTVANLFVMDISAIEIYDIEKFTESYRKLLGIEAIKEMLEELRKT